MPRPVPLDDVNGEIDFDARLATVSNINKRMEAVNAFMKSAVKAAHNMAIAYENVGHGYTDFSSLTTTPQSYTKADRGGADGNALHSAAKLFAMEMQSMREGEILTGYRDNIENDVIRKLMTLSGAAKSTIEAGRQAKESLKDYKKKSLLVDRKITKYSKKNKPISESKLYEKQVTHRDAASRKWHDKRTFFYDHYASTLSLLESTMAETMANFVNISGFLLDGMRRCVGGVGALAAQKYPPLESFLQPKYTQTEAPLLSEGPPTETSRGKRVSATNGTQTAVHYDPIELLPCAAPLETDPYSFDPRGATPTNSSGEIMRTIASNARSPPLTGEKRPPEALLATAPSEESAHREETQKEAAPLPPPMPTQ